MKRGPGLGRTRRARRIDLGRDSSQRPRDRLRDCLRVSAGKPLHERPPGRIVLEIDIGERDPIRVIDGEGLVVFRMRSGKA